MSGYDMWKQSLRDMYYEDTDVFVKLKVEPEMVKVNLSDTELNENRNRSMFMFISVNKIRVFMVKKSKEYCVAGEKLSEHQFGEYNEDNYKTAVEHFKNLVKNLI